jgi:predicted dehydrogenase
MGDAFADMLQSARKNLANTPIKDQVTVDDDHCFVGLDAYQKVIASDVDMVILAAPGGFRPLHLMAAIEGGKHVFSEKPMAVDGPGLRKIAAAVELAKKKQLALRAGLCFRFNATLMEAMKRIHGGAIGDIVAIYTYRMSGSLSGKYSGQRKSGWGDLEWQMRNWSNFQWLSGDWPMEVSCHEIDLMAWALQDVSPVKCVASGGRATPMFGNIFDHFDIAYEYAGKLPAIHKARFEDGCFNGTQHLYIGTKGRMVRDGLGVKISGPNAWHGKAQTPGVLNEYDSEHDLLLKSIRAGKPVNDGDRIVNTMTMANMARMSAYTGKELTPEMVLKSQEDTMPANLSWDMTLPVPALAVPGLTQFK